MSPATGDNATVLGDFSHYGIVDAAMVTVETIPHLFGTNQRPTGQVGTGSYKWTGADVLKADAFRQLQVA